MHLGYMKNGTKEKKIQLSIKKNPEFSPKKIVEKSTKASSSSFCCIEAVFSDMQSCCFLRGFPTIEYQ